MGLEINSCNGLNYFISPLRLAFTPMAKYLEAFCYSGARIMVAPSPSLCALALEPLAILLRAFKQVVGMRMGLLEESVTLRR